MNAEDRAACERAKFLRLLLAEFGLVLRAFDPEVLCSSKDLRDSLSFDGMEWSILQPILCELRDRRAKAGQHTIKDAKAWEKQREKDLRASLRGLAKSR